MLQNYINHISLIVDKSGSMAGQPVVRVFDKELENLKQRSIELNQETRISIYLFNDRIECLTFDMDVMRFKSLQGYYNVSGQTALVDAVLKSTEDQKFLPEKYGDHAFLQYVITDGAENASRNSGTHLREALDRLPDNWTTACLVPDASAKFEAKKFGFSDDSISIWNTSSERAFEKVGQQFSAVTDNFMAMRASGVRGTKTPFVRMTTAGLTKSALRPLSESEYDVYPVSREIPIKELVESWTGKKYRLGSTYFQPVKPIKIQDYKNILVQEMKTGKVYEGNNLRQVLGLPDTTAEVDPGSHRDWRILVQSTSVNRKLFPNTFVLVRK